MASSEIEPAPAAAPNGQPGHAAGAPAEARDAPQGQRQRGLLQRALKEGVIITVLVAAIIAALNLFLAPSDPAKVKFDNRRDLEAWVFGTASLSSMHAAWDVAQHRRMQSNVVCAAAGVYGWSTRAIQWSGPAHTQQARLPGDPRLGVRRDRGRQALRWVTYYPGGCIESPVCTPGAFTSIFTQFCAPA